MVAGAVDVPLRRRLSVVDGRSKREVGMEEGCKRDLTERRMTALPCIDQCPRRDSTLRLNSGDGCPRWVFEIYLYSALSQTRTSFSRALHNMQAMVLMVSFSSRSKSLQSNCIHRGEATQRRQKTLAFASGTERGKLNKGNAG